MVKTCIRCKVDYPPDTFYKDIQKKDGLKPYCKACSSEKARAHYAKNPKLARARAKARRDKDTLEYDLARMGWTKKQYLDKLDEQLGVCAICGSGETLVVKNATATRRLSVDHDHSCCNKKKDTCGQCNRGLLCNRCNRFLGVVDDNSAILQGALIYLKKYKRQGSVEHDRNSQ